MRNDISFLDLKWKMPTGGSKYTSCTDVNKCDGECYSYLLYLERMNSMFRDPFWYLPCKISTIILISLNLEFLVNYINTFLFNYFPYISLSFDNLSTHFSIMLRLSVKDMFYFSKYLIVWINKQKCTEMYV